MRACIRCGETGGTRIGGPCIQCEYDDSDCNDLVAEGKTQAVEETVAAICAYLYDAAKNELSFGIPAIVADAIKSGVWKKFL